MSEFSEVLVDITPATLRSMKKGKGFRLKHEKVGTGNITLMLKGPQHQRLTKAVARKKGVRLQLSPEELDATIQKAGGKLSLRAVGKAVKDTLKPLARPVLKGLAKAGTTTLAGVAASSVPALAPVAAVVKPVLDQQIDKGIDQVGQKYGFGTSGGAMRSLTPADNMRLGIHPRTKYHRLSTDMSSFVPSAHPAMSPPVSRVSGRGIYPAGYHATGRGFVPPGM